MEGDVGHSEIGEDLSEDEIHVYGALRMSVKIHLMLNSKLIINGEEDEIVATTLLEASNLMMLKGSSVIHSNANLGVHGQGSLNLSGPGDLIEAQHLVISLFYTISVGPGSILRNVLDDADSNYTSSKIDCELHGCPVELLHPPEDCNVNASLAFTLQICRVEDVIVHGVLEGSVLHFHWVRSIIVKSSGVISASGMGCIGGLGRGTILPNGVSSGAGHGGRGGDAYYDGEYLDGGPIYGNPDLPCECGSGSGNDSHATAGGGIIVMGSMEHPLSSLVVYGSLRADGQSIAKYITKQDSGLVSVIGSGGGSGGTILLFVRNLLLENSSTISSLGGHGSLNSGGGGGGRIHFHWSDILVGDKFVPIATIKGNISVWGGIGRGLGKVGGIGTVSGKSCPEGLFGIFCQECPMGTYKNVTGSARELCRECPSLDLPRRAIYIAVRGGVTGTPCPYKCISERYHMPHCYTALEELIYTFGGPWLFGFVLLILLVLLAIVLSVARMKFFSTDDLPSLVPARRSIDHSFPFLESLNEVLETNRTEESDTHVHRMYFMGANTFRDPWHLSHSPPQEIKEIVYEDAFNRFVDEINSIATYEWWEGSVHSILAILAFPLAWSWLQWCRTKKIQRLREFVRSEYDHACLRSCRSRALYEGLKVAVTSDMLGYVDFFLGGDEKRDDLPPRLLQRLPMSLVFGGNGSYMSPFSISSDNILTRLMSQSVAPTIWHRLIAGLNAQLRVVRCGHLRDTVLPVINWLESHANPTLRSHGLRADFACFPPSASGYCQYGLVLAAAEDRSQRPSTEGLSRSRSKVTERPHLPGSRWRKALDLVRVNENTTMPNKVQAEILNAKNLSKLEDKISFDFLFYFVLKNTKPVGHQDLVGLVISILLLGDVSLVLLTLLQLYSISMWHVILTLSILPLGILLPFPAGINALFSHGPRRSAGVSREDKLVQMSSVVRRTNMSSIISKKEEVLEY
ncbi:transmembrane signal receptor [Lithospermum erythrorhizon]|uniref:Transmembrane signal receptor n=1 Tax=Lithospermum erythrorhizon TaxID=34254 RepID=A0AAV3QBB8_LITER